MILTSCGLRLRCSASAGIFTAHRVTKKELKKIEKATGAKIVTSLDEIKESAFGSAGAVEEVMMGNGAVIAIRDCPNPHAACLVLRGGTEQVVNALGRAVHDAIRVVGVLIKDGSFVPGGGAPEVELALHLREYAATLKGREQLAVQKFADALEVIPKSLAENAGLDQIDMLIELRSHHKKGQKSFGLNVYKGRAVDMTGDGVVEPLRVKTQAIKSASEAAAMILRIDDVIAAQKSAQPKKSAADMAADMPE